MKAKRYMVIDLEPVGGLSCPLTWNIAWAIVNKKGYVFVKKDYIVSEIWEQSYLFSKEFNRTKKPIAETISRMKLWKVLKEFVNDFNTHGCEAVISFNASFDLRAIIKTCLHVGIENPLNKMPVWDLRQMAKVLTKQKMYNKKSCKMQDIYNYCIKQDTKQKHFAAEDVDAEVKILIQIFRQKKALYTTCTKW